MRKPPPPPGRGSFLEIVTDLAAALKLAFRLSRSSLLRSWIYIPFGITLMLLACFGVDVLLKHIHVTFPASVACLILLFFALLLAEQVLGTHRTRVLVNYLDVPAGWALRWISVFFTPTFVLLPLSPTIGVVEVFKIIAVFVFGFIVMMVISAYMTRTLQLLTGSSKRHAHVERAEEVGTQPNGNEPDIPMSRPVTRPQTPLDTIRQPSSEPNSSSPSRIASSVVLDTLQAPKRLYNSSEPSNSTVLTLGQSSQDPILFTGPRSGTAPIATSTSVPNRNTTSTEGATVTRNSFYRQTPIPPPRSQRWGTYIATRLDWFLYGGVTLFVGLPVYYATGYAMPLHLCTTILSFYIALTLPLSWKRFLHPVLVSAFLAVMILSVIGLTQHTSLPETLSGYRTQITYLLLWEGQAKNIRPGAGDILATILDASIVSLALPMYTYRRELKQHFTAIILPNVILSIGSLFAYPVLCYTIGISAERSLSFAARSLTLALARPAMENLGGDINTVSALAIISGIVGALVGGKMLDYLRIPEDDYVTRGVTLGANSSAIATALLLQTDPRAAALSSLSMSLFGTITVLFTAVPPIRDVVRSMVGL
ncbi:Plastidal glycolate/glycerate translocator 1, chloroplastic [Naviculisporaceae sp. PSN 640]